MLIAKLSISYDRGLARNDERDLIAPIEGEKAQPSIVGRGQTTPDGKIIAGLGTHWRSEEAKQAVKARDQEANRVRAEFRKRFMVTLFEGVYFVRQKGEAKRFLESLNVQGIEARVTELGLVSDESLGVVELREWADKVKRQLGDVSLGRKKDADEEGLRSLEYLSTCPLLGTNTGKTIRQLVEMLRTNKIDKVELRRQIDLLDVEIDQGQLAPRKMPSLVGAGE